LSLLNPSVTTNEELQKIFLKVHLKVGSNYTKTYPLLASI